MSHIHEFPDVHVYTSGNIVEFEVHDGTLVSPYYMDIHPRLE